jgi:CBS domain containing-hemolysin-like protein
MLLFFAAVSVALVVSFYCSIAEATLLSVSKVRIEQLASQGKRTGLILRQFSRHPDVPIAAILILNTVAHTAGAAVAGASFVVAFGEQIDEVWFVAAFTVVVLLFTEIAPKTIGVVYCNRLAGPVAHSVQALVIGLRPVIWLTRLFSRLISAGHSGHEASLEEIRLLVSAGHAEGAFGSLTADIIANATRLRDRRVRDVMVPRNRVVFLAGERSIQENLDTVRKSGHSRFPFTPDGELDRTGGIVLAKELLFHLRDRPQPDWSKLLVPPLFVPETAQLNFLLRSFQSERRHMALVVDEYGAVQGIVTLEDVLEEIVGEIQDELDVDDGTHFVTRPDGSMLCRGIAEIRKVLGQLGVEDVETSSQTVSGYLTEQHGDVPQAGTELQMYGHNFQVTKATNRQVERIRITPLASAAKSGTAKSMRDRNPPGRAD